MIFKRNQQGIALLLSIMLTSLVLFLLIYYLSFSLTENKISKSQISSNSTYYLSEAAINEVVWRLQNDLDWKNNFISSSTWVATFDRVNPLGIDGNYSVTISNSAPAHGTVYATSTMNLVNGKKSQRVISVNIYRAIGGSALGDNAALSDGPITISGSEMSYNGSVHSNSEVVVSNGSDVEINGALTVVGNLVFSGAISDLEVVGDIYAANRPLGPATTFTLPAVDFNTSTSSSLKAQADYVYNAASFDLSSLANDGLVYVIGSLSLNEKTLDFYHRGALVVEGDLYLNFKRWDIAPSSSTTPAGIFASGNLTIDSPNGGQEGTINGVIYAGNKLTVRLKPMGTSHELFINGGLAAKSIAFENAGTGNGGIHFNASSTIVNQSLPNTNFSPAITTDHWEEEY